MKKKIEKKKDIKQILEAMRKNPPAVILKGSGWAGKK
jgi:hypothetical protein